MVCINKKTFFRSLLVAFFVATAFSSFAFDLSPEEQAYLDERGGVIRFVYHGNFMPIEFTNKDGEAAGILPDFIRWMSRRVGFKPEFYAATRSEAKEGLLEGRYDAITSCMYSKAIRPGLIATPPVMEIPTFFFVPVDSSVRTISDMEGLRIAVAGKGFFGFDCVSVKAETLDEQVEALRSGRADALVAMEPVLRYHHYTKGRGDALRAVEPPVNVTYLCIAFSDSNTLLQALLSRCVEESCEEGAARWITRDWVGPEYGTVGAKVLQRIQHVVVGLMLLLVAVLLFWLWDIRLARRVSKKTEQLQNSEERLRTIFQNSPDAIFIEDEEGVVLDANPAACTFHGMSRTELIGQNILNLIPEDRREEVKQDFKKWFTGEMKRYEGFSQTGDGRTVPVEVIGALVQYEGKTAVLLLVRDTTKRKQAEQALRESEMRYRGLIETQNNLIVRVDMDRKFTFVNEAFCRFAGRNRGELIGQYLDAYIYYDDVGVPEKLMETLTSRRERMVAAEYRMRARGYVAWVHWESLAVFDEEGQAVEIQYVGQDITDRRQMDEALQESEKRLSFLFEEISHIAVKGYNAKREAIFWNRASEELYGYSKKEAIGKKMEDLVLLPERREEMIAAFAAWVETGEEIPSGEMIKRHADGREISVYSSCLATRNQQGEREMYVIDVDLSQLKRANEELVKAKDYAEKASRAKSEFLANISHEIRTPMNGVMGMIDLLLDSKLDEGQRDYAETILESTQELIGLIDELLDISRIEAGEVRLTPEPFSPREAVEKVVLLFADRAGKKGVDLSVAIHPNVPEKMMGDASRIRQILINLVGNALKFTHDGHIQIRMQAEKVEDGWNLLTDVKDTGIGMPPELQGHIFEKFTQGDSSSKRKYGGAGLGLSITKQLVELMGGTISVSSEEGKGTSFDFNLRLPDLEPGEEPEEPKSATPEALPKIKADILLVEDNLVNQKVAVAMLEKLGCRVSVAPNGAQALKQIPDHKFDLIFMDCQMPILDGFETTRAIRQMVGAIRDIPIVAMTAHALKEDRQQCLDSGMDDYIAKPVDRNKLIAILRKYCG